MPQADSPLSVCSQPDVTRPPLREEDCGESDGRRRAEDDEERKGNIVEWRFFHLGNDKEINSTDAFVDFEITLLTIGGMFRIV